MSLDQHLEALAGAVEAQVKKGRVRAERAAFMKAAIIVNKLSPDAALMLCDYVAKTTQMGEFYAALDGCLPNWINEPI